ncbi:predicted protein [Naegleria gruberi]|uniref:Predicted protein n=1 Tax=Naegleria gruberi TaxID=5762 RepID=D2VTK8_NAEGR|nr:uncharacterized protein NAEGRDRAFT_72338 [Naegleria gruberi]EFC39948.1 predicted protein [Naegleria gruberi]|eukprot:XP_002672692.1 predicted protein [Naegleria gruberi strain NEG-M]
MESKISDLNVLILGASGHLGCQIVKNLCENHQKDVKCSLLVPSESRDKLNVWEKKLNGKIFCFDVLKDSCEDFVNILKDFTLVLNCMNFFDHEEELKAETRVIESCIKANVKYYIPSDFSIDFTKLDNTEMLPRIDVRKKVHALLNQNTQLKWISILCGIFIEKLLQVSFIVDTKKHALNFYGTGDEEFEISNYEDVAKFVSELIARKEFTKFEYQFVPIYSDRITMNKFGGWLKDVWGGNVKLNCLGRSISDLDKKLRECEKSDKELYYYLQYMKVIVLNKTKIDKIDNQVWPTISKVGARQCLGQLTETGTAI